MVTGNLQLTSTGSADRILTGNPQFTFFKAIYKRHTKYSTNTIEVSESTSCRFGSSVRFKINKNGDLLKNVFLELKVNGLDQTQGGASWVGFTNSFLPSLIEHMELHINEQRIDRINGEFLDIYNEIMLSQGKRIAHDNMIGKYENPLAVQTNAVNNEYTFYLPIPFWFCENISASLPLIALQHSDIYINIKLRESKELVKSDVQLSSITDINGKKFEIQSLKMFGNYIILDAPERRLFASKSHEYLITQHQNVVDYVKSGNVTKIVNLPLRHSIKYITWVIRNQFPCDTLNGNNWTNYKKTDGSNPLVTAKLKFNGMDYINDMDTDYYTKVVPYYYFPNNPRKYINIYSFSEKPHCWKPSGHYNFDTVDDSDLILTLNEHTNNKEILVFAENYNVLRISSGIAGLAFNNL